MKWIMLEKCLLWTAMALVVAAALITLCIIWGCEDTTPPEMKYLGPPVVERMNATGPVPWLDAWELTADGFPSQAAFGWRVTHSFSTGQTFDEPGIHTQFTASDDCYNAWNGPVLGTFAVSSGDDIDDAPAGAITVIADDNGVATIYFGASDWPNNMYVSNGYSVSWHTLGMADSTDAISEVLFCQEMGVLFNMPRGGLGLSWQGLVYEGTSPIGGFSMMSMSPPDPNVPIPVNPTAPLPKVAVAQIQPALVECALSEAYPPSNDPNASGEGVLIHSRWFKVRVADDEWVLTAAPFITPLPYDSNDVAPIAEKAWPYTVGFHAPAESAGLGDIDAELSIVDPNGAPCYTIDIQVHEAGRCAGCDRQLWRSGYILPLVAFPQKPEPLLVRAGDVVVCWLPRGYTMKIDARLAPWWLAPGRAIKIIARLAPNRWLTKDKHKHNPLDINKDGVVNFKDYGVFLRKYDGLY